MSWTILGYLDWTNHPVVRPFVVVGVPLAFGLATEAFFEWRRRRRNRVSAVGDTQQVAEEENS